jgi:6-phospho-3-hexuloisomerase
LNKEQTGMTEPSDYRRALDELGAVLDRVDDAAVERAVDLIAKARTVVVFGGGREGLQIRGLAMRLFHLGRSVAVVGDMTTPAIGPGDLFVVTVGPGEISTALALIGVAKQAGARVLVITAQPDGRAPGLADFVLTVPAQTMADDQGATLSVLPMGSLYEGAIYLLFEIMILKLKSKLNVSAEAMRANHTNLE